MTGINNGLEPVDGVVQAGCACLFSHLPHGTVCLVSLSSFVCFGSSCLNWGARPSYVPERRPLLVLFST